jgi:hypothetical protein
LAVAFETSCGEHVEGEGYGGGGMLWAREVERGYNWHELEKKGDIW